ncbi:hypothetical protein A3B05_03635 [Candidatus Giovannonibacteria bacterium RIFCSPLOWO2_01_FULL_43_160]|uniref:DUF4258 domain-containing protein n=2 Tax=Candidatus Giovannoniibacteriota TaxID=1752738 RepID=A0A0G1IVR1_9BACT|nr:MAG: hypothetical protein UV72_C0003G0024 [Candidatus Giovannonibacteria bacterium GW2011_GWB1_43_13]KKS99267.1 MAG: hypothetical protein UV75_C0007G0024 [Candidatus Giovannonibacteria bacterium GW2011_GWA1_43_15]KKT21084.1 MAG: hypothetical protein UW05_C0018G0015 [Candidatus Giovannonibacteria bacterium GW2011_GWC2_43_8]KKT63150.1 MAG: hypothetical protein UW55_C0006G0019 [Candidatus Giovannonibacteria bacterium GW2011_GWA2_44_26]OGF58210.1 MAG: hypothetical protein A2652_00540 [Candidatus
MTHFTRHALEKFEVLKRHGVSVTNDKVAAILNNPNVIDYSRLPLLIAQGELDAKHVLRVVFKKEHEVIVVITFYPARKDKYGKS